MVRVWTSLLAVLLIMGCAASVATRMDRFRAKNRTNLIYLHRGMPRDSVLTLMGVNQVEISNTFDYTSQDRHGHRTWTLNNPHRTETMAGERDTLEVLYYYTDIKRQDGAITDDELTPLVLREGILIGWGNGFLDESIVKYEVRIR